MPIGAWSDALRNGSATAKEHSEQALERIAATEPELKAFVNVTGDQARAQAEAVDQAIAAKQDPGPLAGVTIGIKDNLCTKGITTTCSSRMLENFVPPYESTVTDRLWKAGAVMVGKTNLDEFAMGSSTETSAFGMTSNPWDTGRVPGGSSGGSAASVAAGQCDVALGSDTGGSIRQPASFCGVVGLKPTYGRVSRWGLVAFASSLDQIGPFSRTVADSAAVLQVIAGHDPRDSTSLDVPVPDYSAALNRPIKGLKIGILKEAFVEGLQPEVEASVKAAAEQLASLGCELVDVSCPRFQAGIATYYVIAPSEASANLARYDGVKYGYRSADAESLSSMTAKSRAECFGDEVQCRILIGTYAPLGWLCRCVLQKSPAGPHSDSPRI